MLHGECVEFGGDELALGPVVAALRDLVPRSPTRVRPGSCTSSSSIGSRRSRRCSLVLEDIHWADHATLALVAFLARNLRDERIAVFATYRADDALSPELRRLAGELGRRRTVLRVALEPLTADDVAPPTRGARGRAGRRRARRRPVHAGGRQPVLRGGALRGAHRHACTEAVLARVERLDGAAARRARRLPAGRRSHTLLERLDVAPSALRAALDAGVSWSERMASRSATG